MRSLRTVWIFIQLFLCFITIDAKSIYRLDYDITSIYSDSIVRQLQKNLGDFSGGILYGCEEAPDLDRDMGSEYSDYTIQLQVQKAESAQLSVSFELYDSKRMKDCLLKKTYFFDNSTDLIAIVDQWSDQVLFVLQKSAPVFSYPISYIEHQNSNYSIILSDVGRHLSTVLYTGIHPIIGLTWSYDGRMLAFIELADKGSSLKLLQWPSLVVSSVDLNQPFIASPSFSIDGNKLYYILHSDADVSSKKQHNKVIEYDFRTGKSQELIADQGWIIDIHRAKDEYHLLLSCDRTGISQIYEYNLLNKKFRQLTFEKESCVNGTMASSHHALFYSLLAKEHSVLMQRFFKNHQTQHIRLAGEVEELQVAPGQSVVSFERYERGSSDPLITRHIVFKSLVDHFEWAWPYDCDVYGPSWVPRLGLLSYKETDSPFA